MQSRFELLRTFGNQTGVFRQLIEGLGRSWGLIKLVRALMGADEERIFHLLFVRDKRWLLVKIHSLLDFKNGRDTCQAV